MTNPSLPDSETYVKTKTLFCHVTLLPLVDTVGVKGYGKRNQA